MDNSIKIIYYQTLIARQKLAAFLKPFSLRDWQNEKVRVIAKRNGILGWAENVRLIVKEVISRPTIKDIYDDKEDIKKFVRRHITELNKNLKLLKIDMSTKEMNQLLGKINKKIEREWKK